MFHLLASDTDLLTLPPFLRGFQFLFPRLTLAIPPLYTSKPLNFRPIPSLHLHFYIVDKPWTPGGVHNNMNRRFGVLS